MRYSTIAAVLPALLAVLPPAVAEEPKAASEPAAAAAKPAAQEAFTPPPGFRKRTRGQFVVYCRREEPKGSRFPKEVCYDEDGLRALVLAQREDQQKVDAMRKVQTITVR